MLIVENLSNECQSGSIVVIDFNLIFSFDFGFSCSLFLRSAVFVGVVGTKMTFAAADDTMGLNSN